MPEEIDWKTVAEELTSQLAVVRNEFARFAAAANGATQRMDFLLEEWHDKIKEEPDGDL